MSNAKESPTTYKCDRCGTFYCEICDRPINFWKWTICPHCNNDVTLFEIREIKKRRQDKQNKRRMSDRFVLRLKNATEFRAIINYLDTAFEEVIFQKTPNALIVKVVDPGRIYIAELSIPKSYFTEYNENSTFFSLDNMTLFNNAIQAIPEGEDLWITGDKKRVQIKLTDGALTFNRLELETKDIDVLVENLRTIKQDAIFAIYSQDLLNALALVALDSSYIVHLNAIPERNALEIVASTLELTAQKIVQTHDLDVKKEAKTVYNMNFLKHFIEFLTPLNSTLKVEFSTEMPLHLSSIMGTNISIDFWLAPRVEEADDSKL